MNKAALAAAAVLTLSGEVIAEERTAAGDAAPSIDAEDHADYPGEDDVRTPGTAVVLGVEKGVLLPLGDWGAFAGVGLGVLGRVEYLLSPRLAWSINPGLLFRFPFFPAFHGGGVENSTTEFLLTSGVKYMVTQDLGIHALSGLNLRTVWGEATKVRGAIILGSRYKLSRTWSIGVNLIVPNLLPRDPDESVGTGLLFTVGHGLL